MSPLAGAQFRPLNIQCESPVLFPKCGNISQADQCFHPQHGATYLMSQPATLRKRDEGRDRGALL